MKEKTLDSFIIDYLANSDTFLMSSLSVDDWKDISQNYANHVKAIALQEGFEKGCKEQKVVCAEHARIAKIETGKIPIVINGIKECKDILGLTFQPDKHSILNAPDATNPYTK